MPAVRAGAVADGERADDQVALCDVTHLGADVFDDPDEFMPDGAGVERRVAAVVPEVGAADAGEHDADDRVGGLGDGGVASLTDGYGVGLVEDGSSHGPKVSGCRDKVRGPVKGVLTGHPTLRREGLPFRPWTPRTTSPSS